ncbi:MAG: hypothetical protein RLZZ227_2095 [Pseudomonadota bacterium]|jgi:PAS domain S-box-containing protein
MELHAKSTHSDSAPADLCEALPLACLQFDANLTLCAATELAARLFCSSVADLRDKTPDLWQAIGIADKKAFAQVLQEILNGRVTNTSRQFTHKLPTGAFLLCEWHFSLYRSPAGPRVIALAREIDTSRSERSAHAADTEQELQQKTSELAQMNRILREKDDRLSTLLRNIPLGIVVVGLDSRYTGEMNPAYFNMLGYDSSELAGLTPDHFTHPDDLDRNLAIVGAVGSGRQPVAHYEKRFIHKNGKVVWARVSLSPLLDVDGKVYDFIAVVEDISTEKAIQHKLQRNEELSRIAGQIGRIGGWMREPGINSALYWSDQVYAIYEYEGSAPLSIEEVFAMVKPPYRDLCWSTLNAMTTEGKRIDYECEITTCKGNEVWLRVVGEPQHGADGKVTRITGAIQDITALKAQEFANRELSARLTSMLDTMTDAFILIDRHWQIVYMNGAAEALLKLNLQMRRSGSIWDNQPWLMETSLYEAYQRAMREGVRTQCEYYSPRLQVWIEAFVYPSNEGLAVYFRSITERKKLAAQVADSEEKLRYLARATLDVVWERHLDTHTIHWNSGLAKLGYGGNTDEGRAVTEAAFWFKRIHPEESDAVISSLDTVLKSNLDHWGATYRFLKADGTYIHVMDRGVILRDRELRPTRMIGGMADISERVKLVEHLQQNQRIESIGKLTGGLAHDFNNLLTVILGNGELLGNLCADDATRRKLADNICSSALKGAELTQRLLAFARRQELEPAAVNVNTLVTTMEGLLMRTLGEHISMKIVASPGLATALADRNQLESAILNLCINSRDAMPQGGEICIETFNITLTGQNESILGDVIPGDYVAIRVSDNGCGIEQDVLPLVFEPFFTTKERGKGTGLGLSTVFGFMRQSNGNVSIESSPDWGTRVTLYLPVTQQQEKSEASISKRQTYADGNETILLVEDDISVRNFSSHFLQSLGYTVVVAENGVKALKILSSRSDIDLLFTDIIMPGGIDGAELAQRALAQRPDLPVLYTSGYTDDALLKQGMLDIEKNFVAKPYSLTRMAARVRETLDRARDALRRPQRGSPE